MKSVVFTLGFFFSISVFAEGLLPNKCWNTRLSKEDKRICEYCIDHVGVEKDENNPCQSEQERLNECFAANLECDPPYDILLKENYNCRTALVNACFESMKKAK